MEISELIRQREVAQNALLCINNEDDIKQVEDYLSAVQFLIKNHIDA